MKSIFTDDFNRCYITGVYRTRGRIEVHHIYPASNRKRSDKYGFCIPLLASIHPNGSSANNKECFLLTGMTLKELDTMLKKKCQLYYETKLGKTRDEFINEFGRNYL